jgi:predicted CXXCH cytochrome family protein
MPRRTLPGLLSLALLGFAAGAAPAPESPAPAGPAGPPPYVAPGIAEMGFSMTGGAAPGYVEDRACAVCHRSISASYREKGMARAFYRPRPATDVEDFSAPPFVHAPSGRTFQIVRDGERLVFRRWETDAAGRPIHLFEREIDWVMGSGNNARVYLYRSEGGEMFQLPLAWYTQTGRWGMAPGFDRPDHEGVLRRVRRECMFCHNAYPDVPEGSDAGGAPHTFPVVLPEGLGCQRCHGPGAEHVWLAMGGIGVAEEIRASIFNPGRLPPERRDEVCSTCHLQPTVTFPFLRRFGRGDYGYRAGEPLASHTVRFDVEEEGQAPAERFEINHHAYRLRQSRCFLESGKQLGCLSCHDPHAATPKPEMRAAVRQVCLGCHASPPEAAGADHAATADCASCHMPRRRTQDVVQVVMTDHLIQRRPGGPERLAPLAERDPTLTDLQILPAEGAPAGDLARLYRVAAVVRAVGGAEAVDYMEKMLARVRPAEAEPYLDLAQGQLGQRRFADAEATLAGILERWPGEALAVEWLGLARAAQGKLDEGIALLRRSLETGSGRVEAEYNLGRLLAARGDWDEAEARFTRAVAASSNLFAGWHQLGELRAKQGRHEEAAACYRRALAIHPGFTDAYLGLARSLAALGKTEEAERYLRHGAAGSADRPGEVGAEESPNDGAVPGLR